MEVGMATQGLNPGTWWGSNHFCLQTYVILKKRKEQEII